MSRSEQATRKYSWISRSSLPERTESDGYNTREGKNVKINLIPMGSIEGAHAILGGDQRIHAWSPASAVYKDVFVQDWQVKYSSNPIQAEEALATRHHCLPSKAIRSHQPRL